jgi:UDP-N-acetylmuramoylalanine--D-glutamate ligase
VISEIEFAAPFTKAVTIGVTGSNGKTPMLTYHLLKSAGLNIGLGKHWKSFALQVANDTYDSYILELSSFQLGNRGLQTTHCYNNKYKSGSDRYEYNYQNYINAKFRITMNQTEMTLIYDADDEALQDG